MGVTNTIKDHLREIKAGAFTSATHSAIILGSVGLGVIGYLTGEMPKFKRPENRHGKSFAAGIATGIIIPFSLASAGAVAVGNYINPEPGKLQSIQRDDWGKVTTVGSCKVEDRTRNYLCYVATDKFSFSPLNLKLMPYGTLAPNDKVFKQTIWYENAHEISYCREQPGQQAMCVLYEKNRGGKAPALGG